MGNEKNVPPHQGQYTGAQIDQAIEMALSPHVDKFNGRTGVVVPQSGDYTSEQISFTPPTGMTADNVQDAVEALFTSVSEGKSLIASAVTDMGVPTAADASFETMKDNILSIETGGDMPEDMYAIIVAAEPEEGGVVSGGGIASGGMMVTVQAEPETGYLFKRWEEENSEVSSDLLYSFKVSAQRDLKALFSKKLLPDGYTALEYIESTGTQYIATGIYATSNTQVFIDAQCTDLTLDGCILGFYAGSSSTYAIFWKPTKTRKYVQFYFGDYVQGSKTIDNAATVERKIYSIRDHKGFAGDLSVNLSQATFPEGESSVVLCARSSQGGISDYIKMKIFSCQFYENAEKLRDYIPCKTDSGEVGLYDLVNKKFYRGIGTDPFIAGPAV